MTKLYDYLSQKTDWSKEMIATISFYANMLFWLVVGCLIGYFFCLLTENPAYQNIVGGTGAFMAITFGVVIGLIRIFLYAD